MNDKRTSIASTALNVLGGNINNPVAFLNPALPGHPTLQAEQPGPEEDLLATPPLFVEMLPIAIYACDASGRLRWFNRRAAELWGREPLVGDDTDLFCGSFKLFHLDGRLICREESPMALVLKTGTPVHGKEATVERSDGSRVTALVHIDPIKDKVGNVVGAINCFHDITERKQAEDRLRESERASRELLEALPAAIYTTDAAGRITFYNQAAVDLSGRRPELGSDQWCVTWRLYKPDGTPMSHDECPMAVALKEGRAIRDAEAVAERPDGTRVPFIPYPTPLRDAAGTMVGAVNMLVDISERKTAETRQKLLVDELNHRVKNTLATVQALVKRTARGSGSPEDFYELLEGRLMALSNAHDQLSRRNWEQVDLRDIASASLAPYRNEAAGNVTLAGDSIDLDPRSALTLAMIFHELATNAAKYGALSVPGGWLNLAWKVERSESGVKLRLSWRERGGPKVKKPARRGFGTLLVERGIKTELGGAARLDFAATGVCCEIELALPASVR
jgi:PAS domain S-box-containing protein